MLHQIIRIIIADDHPIIVEGIQSRLVQDSRMHVVGVARSFLALTELLKTTVADVVILDLTGLQTGPITMVEYLRRVHPTLALVVFSSVLHLAPELIHRGVLGYVVKEELACHLLAAVDAAWRGVPFLSPTVADYLVHAKAMSRQSDLSAREIQVLKFLAQGLGTEAIARQLGIDPRSVQNYITILRRKTGCDQRTQLAEWYRQLFE